MERTAVFDSIEKRPAGRSGVQFEPGKKRRRVWDLAVEPPEFLDMGVIPVALQASLTHSTATRAASRPSNSRDRGSYLVVGVASSRTTIPCRGASEQGTADLRPALDVRSIAAFGDEDAIHIS